LNIKLWFYSLLWIFCQGITFVRMQQFCFFLAHPLFCGQPSAYLAKALHFCSVLYPKLRIFHLSIEFVWEVNFWPKLCICLHFVKLDITSAITLHSCPKICIVDQTPANLANTSVNLVKASTNFSEPLQLSSAFYPKFLCPQYPSYSSSICFNGHNSSFSAKSCRAFLYT